MGVQADSAQNIKIIVWDHTTYPRPPEKKILQGLTEGVTFAEVAQTIAMTFNLPQSDFEIVRSPDLELTSPIPVKNGTASLTVKWTPEQEAKRRTLPSETYVKNDSRTATTSMSQQQEREGDTGTFTNTAAVSSTAVVPYGPKPFEYTGSGFSSSFSSYNKEVDAKQKSGYVGLSNQGATCYMNSLIQTLYMTPEFRAALYGWSFEEYFHNWKKQNEDKMTGTLEEVRTEREKKSIPRQLQLLFARLQIVQQRAAKTKDLTSSFGWKDSDAFTQHDVQELMRVLFDALENVLKGTEQENLINELYQGTMKDYVKCLECGNESSRTDKYLDIPLVIRGFGETKAVSSIEEALQKFVTSEDLKGDNQYSCEKCGKKTDAKKGLKLTEFPSLLTLQLKRFDFDYSTFRRIKLNDRVTFPHILDLNHFLKDEEPVKTSNEDGDSDTNADVPMLEDSGDYGQKDTIGDDDDGNNRMSSTRYIEDYIPSYNNSQKEEKKEVEAETPEARREKARKLIEKNGKYVYELYSVLIHRGSALGGHYYAYIKSLSNGRWFDFNDSNVTEISEEEVSKTFGEEKKSTTSYSSFYASGANAYMLMYRLIDPDHIESDAQIPEELSGRIDIESKRHKEKIEEQEREKNMISLKIHRSSGDSIATKVSKTDTVRQMKLHCASLFPDTKDMDPSLYRLRVSVLGVGKQPIDDEKDQEKQVYELHWNALPKPLLLETRLEGQEFPVYNADNISLRVNIYNNEKKCFDDPVQLSVPSMIRLNEFQELLHKESGINHEDQRVTREHTAYGQTWTEVTNCSDTNFVLREGWKLYLESKADFTEEISPSIETIEKIKNAVEIKVYLFGSKEPQVIQFSKKDTVGKLRTIISEKFNEPADSFKLNRWHNTVFSNCEFKIDSETLMCTSVYVERGRPSKEGEVNINFLWFDPMGIKYKEPQEIFKLQVQENINVLDLKKFFAEKLKEEKDIEVDYTKLRFRELSYKSPGIVFTDAQALNKMTFQLCVEIMDQIEDKTDIEELSIFIKRWNPSTFTTDNVVAITLPKDADVDFLKRAISERYNIENVGLARNSSHWPGPEILEVPDLRWDDITGTKILSDNPLYLRDSDIIFFKDNLEVEKVLTPEEKKKMEQAAQAKRRQNYHGKEEALKINTQD